MYEREERYIPLPAPLSTTKEIILQILHNPHLLSDELWREYTLSYSKTESDTTVLVLTHGSLATKVTFTNHDDGVSVFEQSKTGVSILIRWPVTQKEYAGIEEEERGHM